MRALSSLLNTVATFADSPGANETVSYALVSAAHLESVPNGKTGNSTPQEFTGRKPDASTPLFLPFGSPPCWRLWTTRKDFKFMRRRSPACTSVSPIHLRDPSSCITPR
jgi:hypothetical protein